MDNEIRGIEFAKGHGTENDFVLLPDPAGQLCLTPSRVRALCDRHRGLGAATATSIHLGGPGRFYYTGLNVRFLDLNLLKEYLWQMVKMSPLQSYSLEVVPDDPKIAVIGAAGSALLAPTS